MSKIVRYRIDCNDINRILDPLGIVPLEQWKDQDIHSPSLGDVTTDLSVNDYIRVKDALGKADRYTRPIWDYTPEERLQGKIEIADKYIAKYKKEKEALENEYRESFGEYTEYSKDNQDTVLRNAVK